MRKSLLKSATIGLSVIGLSLLAQTVQADPLLPNLENLNFLSYSGSAPKNTFQNVDPVGWTGGSGLIYIDAPGTSTTSSVTACGTTYLSTWGCPSTLAIKGGYNFVEADGNPAYESGFNYEVTGLTKGQAYTLSFYQAASQQGPNSGAFFGATTNQWIVSLGTSGLFVPNVGSCNTSCTYENTDSTASIVATQLMHVASGGLQDWQFVSVNVTADATSDLLSFLAWGDNGSEVNLPPIAFLAGVNSASGLNNAPEPATLSLFGAGLLGLGALRRRWRGKQRAKA